MPSHTTSCCSCPHIPCCAGVVLTIIHAAFLLELFSHNTFCWSCPHILHFIGVVLTVLYWSIVVVALLIRLLSFSGAYFHVVSSDGGHYKTISSLTESYCSHKLIHRTTYLKKTHCFGVAPTYSIFPELYLLLKFTLKFLVR